MYTCDAIDYKRQGLRAKHLEDSDPLDPEIKKRTKGYTEVEIVSTKRIKIYHKEDFDSKPYVEHVEDKCPGFSWVYKLSRDCKNGYDLISDDDFKAMPKQAGLDGYKLTSSPLTFGIVVMPKDKIKNSYTEGDDLDELCDYLCCPFSIKNALKKVKNHPDGCRCKKCKK